MIPEISIIIRTFNEEQWIYHTLYAIETQNFKSYEIIIVDSGSNDFTVKVAKRFKVSKVIKIKKFLPGKAINIGIQNSIGKYIVCLSAHCIPYNNKWLESLYKNIQKKNIGGVYGRQLPLPYTSDKDKRDLLITFGKDRKIQSKDYFFHNANSIFSRELWKKIPFDNLATNIEDRMWAKEVIDKGYRIIYEPKASVYHYHGLHQHGNSNNRASGIAKILNRTDYDSVNLFPHSLQPINIPVAAVFLTNESIETDELELKSFKKALEYAKESIYIKKIYVLSNFKKLAEQNKINWINRNKKIFKTKNINVESLLSSALHEIEKTHYFPQVIIYINHFYTYRPKKLFDNVITQLQISGKSSVFPSYVDYGHYWQKNTNDNLMQIDSSLNSRNQREPVMKALYGLGCATLSKFIREKSLIGDSPGIYLINDFQYTLNIKDSGVKNLIQKIYD